MADDKKLPSASSSAEVDAFIRKVAATPGVRAAGERGRLIFAMDATASREPTWDRASHIQAEMFQETSALGGLDIQLVYYRGFGEFDAGPWIGDPERMLRRMTRVFCLAGQTQIAKVLKHAVEETKRQKVAALVFVGDCLEEDIDRLGHLAGELGPKGIRVNGLSAGPIKTLAARGIKDFSLMLQSHAERAALRRNVTVEEVADTALFLSSPLSSGVTGEILYVDGGFRIMGT